MAQPRVANEEGMLIKNLPIHADAILSATVLEVGDMLRWQSEATATDSGAAIFDTLLEDDLFLGFSKGKTKTDMESGAFGDHIPIMIRGLVQIDLVSANYNFGQPLAFSAKNLLTAAVVTTTPTLVWFWGSDEDTITTGLVIVDVLGLNQLFEIIN